MSKETRNANMLKKWLRRRNEMVYSPVNPWTFPSNPNFPWLPQANTIISITQANPAVVTTATNHGYQAGFNIRIFFPFADDLELYGMPEIDGQQTTILQILSPTTFSIAINTLNFNSFTPGNSAITNITQATSAVVTVSTQNFALRQNVSITGVSGMTQINGTFYEVIGVSGNTVTLFVDSSGFGAYTGGGMLVNTESVQVLPISQYVNGELLDFTQVNPVNPNSLLNVPLFQRPGLQAPGACNTSQT